MLPFDAILMGLMRTIVAGDADAVKKQLARNPLLAGATIEAGATRRAAKPFFLDDIKHYVYGGDTALHVAAAAYQPAIVRLLLTAASDPSARNKRGAEPLHYASDGIPGSKAWNPKAQAKTIAMLVKAGADPNSTDSDGTAPLHRAVRTRSTAAVQALLDAGADRKLKNGRGSSPLALARRTTGRSGSGSDEAKVEEAAILKLLKG